MSEKWVFDSEVYDARNAALGKVVRTVLPGLIDSLKLKTVLDLGCGLGHYANLLRDLGLEVLAVDGRKENVEEARRRYPGLEFQLADAQDPGLPRLGSFDLVFCFGLIYHLENPFATIRSIGAMTPKLTFVEGMVYPSPEPVIVLMDEKSLGDQGLNYVAFYPSETCLVKMLRRAGFSGCYLPEPMPDHPEYQVGGNGFRMRSVFVGSKTPIASPALAEWAEPSPNLWPWEMKPLYAAHRGGKIYRTVDQILRGKSS